MLSTKGSNDWNPMVIRFKHLTLRQYRPAPTPGRIFREIIWLSFPGQFHYDDHHHLMSSVLKAVSPKVTHIYNICLLDTLYSPTKFCSPFGEYFMVTVNGRHNKWCHPSWAIFAHMKACDSGETYLSIHRQWFCPHISIHNDHNNSLSTKCL